KACCRYVELRPLPLPESDRARTSTRRCRLGPIDDSRPPIRRVQARLTGLVLEVELRADLHEPRVNDVQRIRPAGPVPVLERQPVARVQRVCEVEIDHRAVPPAHANAEDLAEAQVELVGTRPVLRAARDRGGRGSGEANRLLPGITPITRNGA